MSDITNENKNLRSYQKIILLLISLVLVVFLFFLRNGFKANSILDQLERNSLLPQQALTNGRPTIFEFYADWCEACKAMAPSMIDIKKMNNEKINVVLLNVDNPRWSDLLDKYDVNGIPQLNFFDIDGESKGFAIGIRDKNELSAIFEALIYGSELPPFTKSSKSSELIKYNFSEELVSNNNYQLSSPRSHS